MAGGGYYRAIMRGWHIYIYIYVGGTFLDKELSLSLSLCLAVRVELRGAIFITRLLLLPTLLGWKRAGKQDASSRPERYFPYARAGGCLGLPFGRKGWISGGEENLERGGREEGLFNSASPQRDDPRVPFASGLDSKGMIASYSYGHRFYLFARDPGINRVLDRSIRYLLLL